MGPGDMAPIRINLHTLVRYWLVSPFTCAVLATLILGDFRYFLATRDDAERGNHWPPTRTLAFFSGLVTVELAFQSSLAMLPYISFPIQVIQKLLLVLVAAPLLVLGAPLALAVETSAPRTTAGMLRVVRCTPLRALTHPVAIFLLYGGGLLGYYLSSAVASSMRHVWLLNLFNVAFLLVAIRLVGGPGRRAGAPAPGEHRGGGPAAGRRPVGAAGARDRHHDEDHPRRPHLHPARHAFGGDRSRGVHAPGVRHLPGGGVVVVVPGR